jgi:hypothetical protein
MNNSSDLGPQVVHFLTKEKWVREDFSIQIPCEMDFNLSCSFNLRRSEVRQLGPTTGQEVCCYEVGVFVDTSALFFDVWLSGLRAVLVIIVASLYGSLGDVVVEL